MEALFVAFLNLILAHRNDGITGLLGAYLIYYFFYRKTDEVVLEIADAVKEQKESTDNIAKLDEKMEDLIVEIENDQRKNAEQRKRNRRRSRRRSRRRRTPA